MSRIVGARVWRTPMAELWADGDLEAVEIRRALPHPARPDGQSRDEGRCKKASGQACGCGPPRQRIVFEATS